MFLWASYLSIQNIHFTHTVPLHGVLTLTAKKITGRKIVDINDVQGTYASWLFNARHILLNTKNHTIAADKIVLNCHRPTIRIEAQSGLLDLPHSNATIQFAKVKHRNIICTGPKASYNHTNQKISCWGGRIEVLN